MTQNNQLTVAVVIPALNEEQSLPLVLREIPRDQVQAIIVVDNGSVDKTAEVAAAAQATVVHESKRGYGAACLKGIASLPAVDVVIFLDADYSDDPKDMSLLLERIALGDDLVIGSRLLGRAQSGAVLPQAYWGNKLACLLMRLFFGFRFTDLGPFRAIRREALEKIQMQDQSFGWTVEMQVKAIVHQLKISEVSVAYKKRIGVSKITGSFKGAFLAGVVILRVIFVSWWRFRVFQRI